MSNPAPIDAFSVPGSSMRFLEKSRGLSADCVAYDLEDSVTPGKKAEARSQLREFLTRERVPNVKEQAVRINSVGSGYALDDLTQVVRRGHMSLNQLTLELTNDQMN